MRSLWAVEGEVRPGEVVSTRSGCGLLADAGMGPLIKLPGIRLVREMSPGRILIGCWAGRLVRLRKLGMLHLGTPRRSGWLAGSRRASRCVWLLMMLSSLPSGSHLSGEFAWLCCRGMVLFAVVSGRDGGRVRDPVEAAFQGRSGHRYNSLLSQYFNN